MCYKKIKENTFVCIINFFLILSLVPAAYGGFPNSYINDSCNLQIKDNDSLDQSQIIWNSGIAVGFPDCLAQSFKPTNNTLTRVQLLASKIDIASNDLKISIRNSLNGADLTSISLPLTNLSDNKKWIEFDFPDILVNISHTYYIIWKPMSSELSYVWYGSKNQIFDSYSRGNAWWYTGGQWSTEGFVIGDWCFKTYITHSSLPPNIPDIPSGLQFGTSGTIYSYTTNTTDPDGDDIKYGWDWNGDNITDEWTEFKTSGRIVNTSHTWNKSGTYYIKVKAEDIYGESSNFSEPLTVAMINDAPNDPRTPEGVEMGFIKIKYNFSTDTTDPDGDDIKYGWDWNGDNITDEWTEFFKSEATVEISHIWNFSGIYHIKVIAKDIYGALSEFSPSKKIVIINIDNDPPDKPSCPSGPKIGKTGISYSFSSIAYDPNNDNIYYLFDWDDGTNSDWKGPFHSGQAANISHVWNNKGTYQIKVKVKDVHGEESVWSDPLPISMPKNKVVSLWLYTFFETNSYMFPLLRQLLELK